jgi:hypothetical protein
MNPSAVKWSIWRGSSGTTCPTLQGCADSSSSSGHRPLCACHSRSSVQSAPVTGSSLIQNAGRAGTPCPV